MSAVITHREQKNRQVFYEYALKSFGPTWEMKLDRSQRQTETVWSLTQRKVARGQEVETKKVEDLEVFGVKSPEPRRVWKNGEEARASGICKF